jgi:hypothetical protein
MKTETIEEAATKYIEEDENNSDNECNDSYYVYSREGAKQAFINGAKSEAAERYWLQQWKLKSKNLLRS